MGFQRVNYFGSFFFFEAIRAKTVLSKFCDSVLAKNSKIRGLIADLQKNYVDTMAGKSLP